MAQTEAHEKAKALEMYAEQSNKVEKKLEIELEKRKALEQALQDAHAQGESKVTETSLKAKEKERELQAQLDAIDKQRKAREEEMERRIREERAILETTVIHFLWAGRGHSFQLVKFEESMPPCGPRRILRWFVRKL